MGTLVEWTRRACLLDLQPQGRLRLAQAVHASPHLPKQLQRLLPKAWYADDEEAHQCQGELLLACGSHGPSGLHHVNRRYRPGSCFLPCVNARIVRVVCVPLTETRFYCRCRREI